MKKTITIITAIALVLGVGAAAFAMNNARTEQTDVTQEKLASTDSQPEMNSQLPEMNGQLPEMNGQAPEMNGQAPQMNGPMAFGPGERIDFDAMVTEGVISQETCDRIRAYMEEHSPADLPRMNDEMPETDGQMPQMNGQMPPMDGQAPDAQDLTDLPAPPERDAESSMAIGLLDELLANGVITQTEYDALCRAVAA